MRRAVLVVVVCATACSFRASGVDRDATKLDAAIDAAIDATRIDGAPGSGRKKRITVDPARVIDDQPGFPLWLVLDGDDDLRQRALADASDLYFTRSDGVPIEWELQRWDKPSGHLEAWVRLDLDDTAPTMFDLRYGDPGPAHAPDPAKVFEGAFVAVWHLESPTSVPDATNTHPGTPFGLTAGHGAAAQLGRGIRFDGTTAEVRFANPIAGTGPHTISAWVDQTATVDNDALVVLGNGKCGESRFLHGRFDNPTLAVGFYCNDWPSPNVNIVDAGWVLIHWVYEAGQSTIYRGGVVAAGPFAHTGTAINTKGTGGHLGYAPGGGNGWGDDMGAHAALDEVRIATTARKLGYIATEYNNQSSPQTFFSVGPEQPAP